MLFRTTVLDVDTESGKKPVEFYPTSVFEYHIGWRVATTNRKIEEGLFPDSPYIREVYNGSIATKNRLYTRQMVDEAVELVEKYHPPIYRGKNPVLKTAYLEEMNVYKQKVKELQTKWNDTDYLEIAEATIRFRKKNYAKK
jgi:hypothetical protein